MNKKAFAFIMPVLVILLASFFASKLPDTLETLAINYKFDKKAKEVSSLFSGYSLPFIGNNYVSTFLAGIIGLAIIYALFKTINNIVRRFAK